MILELIKENLRERDELYRRLRKSEERVEELSDADYMRRRYEERIQRMDSDHAKEVAKLNKRTSEKEEELRKMTCRLDY